MSETSLKPVIDKLENLFSKFNEKFYNGELQTPIITVSPDTTKGAYGWCTAWKAWSNKQPEQKKTVDLAVMSKEDLENLKRMKGSTKSIFALNTLQDLLKRLRKRCFTKWFTFTIYRLGFRTQAGAVLITIRNTKKPPNSTV